jgi:hypothetical protein
MPRRKPPDKKMNPEKYAEYYENYFVRTGEKLHARSNRKFRLEGATVDPTSKKLSERERLLELSKEHGNAALRTAPRHLRDDYELVMSSVKQCGTALCYASPDKRRTRSVVLAAVDQSGHALSFASTALQDDDEVVTRACYENGLALVSASTRLRGDRDHVATAVRGAGTGTLVEIGRSRF